MVDHLPRADAVRRQHSVRGGECGSGKAEEERQQREMVPADVVEDAAKHASSPFLGFFWGTAKVACGTSEFKESLFAVLREPVAVPPKATAPSKPRGVKSSCRGRLFGNDSQRDVAAFERAGPTPTPGRSARGRLIAFGSKITKLVPWAAPPEPMNADVERTNGAGTRWPPSART